MITTASRKRISLTAAAPAALPRRKPLEFLTARRGRREPGGGRDYPCNAPGYFLVGCSDYRAAEAAIVAKEFVESKNTFHDNVANLVVPTDINCLSALQCAVEIRGVKNIAAAAHHNRAGARQSRSGS